MRRSIRILAVLAALLVGGAAIGQTSNGIIAGTVVDSTGAGVARATVKIVGNHTGFERDATTNSVGGFRLDSVLLDTYTVTAEAPGFSRRSITDVLVTASVLTSVNPVLAPGRVTETVQVRAASELIQTGSGELSATVGTQSVENLPIFGLSPYELATTLPGVAQPPAEFQNAAGEPNGFQFSVNGGRPRSNNFLIEGQDNNDLGLHGQAIEPENTEAYSDVTFLLNSYSAEFGHGGGSVSNLILKSGTNSFHGAVWDRLSNSSLDALDKGDLLNGATSKSKDRENTAGFSVGGPAMKDKLFFFASYQFDHYRATANTNPVIVPTAAGLAMLKALPSNARIAAYLEAIGNLQGQSGSAYTSSLPLGSAPGSLVDRGSVEVGPYRRNLKDMEDSSELDIKSDYLISPKDTFQLHYIRSPSLDPYDTDRTALPGFDVEISGATHNAGIAETHIFSPNLLNEFRFSYSRIGFVFGPRPDTYANPQGTSATVSIGTGQGVIPGTSGDVTGFGAPGGFPQARFHNTFQTQDTVGWTRGKHTLRMGFDLPVIQVRDQSAYNLYGSVSYGPAGSKYSGLADYIDDFGGSQGTVAKSFGNPIARPVFYYQNYFAEDNWQATPNLTMEIGFRYEYWGTPFSNLKYAAATSTSVGDYLSAVRERPDTQDWGPRFGFAYTPEFLGGKKTVIRGGFGVFYDGVFTNIDDNILVSAPNSAAPSIISTTSPSMQRGIGSFSSQFANLTPNAGPTDQAEYITPELVSPRILQWNLNVERQLPFSFSGQIGYVGTRGEHLFATTDFNPYVNDSQGDTTRIFNTRGKVILEDNSGDSIYHALQAQLVRKYRSGLSFRAAYTFSRMEDDTSEVLTEGQFSTYASVQYPSSRKQTDYGLSAFDHRQRLVFSYVYEIPKWSEAPRAVGEIVNGWQVSGVSQFQSGNPANVEIGGGTDWNGDEILNDRPEVGNPKAPLASYAVRGDDVNFWGAPAPAPAGTYCDGATAWYDNTCTVVPLSSVHWVLPVYGTRGNPVGRNSVILRGFEQWDFSAQKSFATWKEQSFDFRAEMFDVFNHGDTGTPNLSLITGFSDPELPNPQTTFDNYAPTVTGHRSIRMFLRYRF
jgi:hypothetical protein